MALVFAWEVLSIYLLDAVTAHKENGQILLVLSEISTYPQPLAHRLSCNIGGLEEPDAEIHHRTQHTGRRSARSSATRGHCADVVHRAQEYGPANPMARIVRHG